MRLTLTMLGLTALACAAGEPEKPRTTIEFRVGGSRPGPGLVEMTLAGTGQKVYVKDETLVSNEDIESASVKAGKRTENDSSPQIEIVFNDKGKAKFAEATAASIGKPLAIIINGKLLSAPIVREKIHGGRAVITGSFSEEEAKRIAAGIAGGK
jgi:preprotein translocase subunit SecD